MGWFGKVAGAFIGGMIGGPLGAMGGIFLGSLFDEDQSSSNEQNISERDKVYYLYFVALFSLMGKLAKADGLVTNDEIRFVDYFIKDVLKLKAEEIKYAREIFNRSKEDSTPIEDFANQYYNLVKGDRDLLHQLMLQLLELAMADKSLHLKEDILLQKVANCFHFKEFEYQQMKSFYIKDNSKFYEILGCSEHDDLSKIKKNYRRLIKEYHPDKIMGKGLPDDFVELAKVKFQEIQEAYEEICKERSA
jgi:DnaJ like chaperone protein